MKKIKKHLFELGLTQCKYFSPIVIRIIMIEFTSILAQNNWHSFKNKKYIPNVSLTDQNSCMMNGFGQSQFENLK